MFERILITTDGSELAEDAVTTAVRLAQPGQCQFRIVFVIEPGLSYGSQPKEAGFFDNDFYRRMHTEIETHAQEAAGRMKSSLEEAGFECSVALRNGNPGPEIVDEAKDWGAEVILMATHGRRGVSRALLGSVAGEIVHSSTCPVLLHR